MRRQFEDGQAVARDEDRLAALNFAGELRQSILGLTDRYLDTVRNLPGRSGAEP